MKALVYNKRLPGKLIYSDVEKPVPDDNQVLIKIIAASVNAADYRMLKLRIIPKSKIIGADIAGKVESVGKNVSQFKPGDEVLGDLSDFGSGGFAEYAVAPEKALVLKPKKVSFEEAATLPISAVTALQALRDKGNIQKGQNVLIVGSAGGVGTYAVQFAKYYGATVTAICSTRNIEQTKELGADYVIDYTKEDFTKKNKCYDTIIVVNGFRSVFDYKKILNSNGTFVMIGGSLRQIFKTILFGWMVFFGSRKMHFLEEKLNQKDLEFIANLVENGKIKSVIEKRYSLDKATDAIKYIAEGHARGKLVINIMD